MTLTKQNDVNGTGTSHSEISCLLSFFIVAQKLWKNLIFRLKNRYVSVVLAFKYLFYLGLFLFLVVQSVATAQTEPPQFMTVDGRLYNSTAPEDPLLDNSVQMKIQILNPAKTCILYEEQQIVSTLSSNGYFNVRVGSPTSGAESLKRTTATIDVGNSMRQIFQNQNASIAGKTAAGVVCGYTPVAGDTRHFRYIVTPSTTGVTSTLSPDMQIDSVPQSLVAESLQGLAPSDFVQITSDVTQAKMNGLFGPSYTTLTGLLAGSSSLYLQNTTNGTVIPSRATNPLTPAAGQIWYDNDDFVMRYYDGTSVLTLGISGGDPTKLPLAGGTMAGAIDMGNNDITNLGHVTQTTQRTFRFGVYTTLQQGSLISTPLVAGHEGTVWYNTTTNKLMFWDGAAAFAVSPVDSVFGRTGAVVAATSDYDAVQIDNAPAGNIAATNAQAAMDELDSEKVTKAGDTMTGQLNMGPKGVAVGDGGTVAFTELLANGTAQVGFRAPDDVTTSVIWALPPADGSSGQVLRTNGAGLLSWVSSDSAITADSLNFTSFADALALDASTDISVTGAMVLSITNSGTGNSLVVNDQAADTTPLVVDANGNMGIGTTVPATKLDVVGELKVGTGASACTAGTAGGVRYNSATPCLEYCDGALWRCMQTTICASNLPTSFSFTNQANVAVSTLISSNIVQITAINACTVEISISGQGTPQYRTCSDATCTSVLQDWTASRASIENNQYVQIRLTSSASGNVNFFSNLSVGARSVGWQVSTTGDCTAPTPTVGTFCADGSVYTGLSPDTGTKMYTTPCDHGRTWNGTTCTGTRVPIPWSVGATVSVAGLNNTQGAANTAILAPLSNVDSPYSAAIVCDGLIFAGKSDWYLPSMIEGNAMLSGCALLLDTTCSDSSDYWSSTQNSSNQSRTFRFSGALTFSSKTSASRIRCVRKD